MTENNFIKFLELLKPIEPYNEKNNPNEPDYSDINNWAATPDIDAVSYTHLTLPTTPYV